MKKILLILFLLFTITISGMALTYTSQYPPTQSGDYVKATTTYQATNYDAWHTTNPAKSVTDAWLTNQWLSGSGVYVEQRFHIDLGSAKIIRRIYYENSHNNGALTGRACKNFTFWGSNTGAGTFDDLVYANDEGWTQLTISQSTLDEHVALNQADPKYIIVTNTVAYRYYAFKFADGWSTTTYMGVRRIELQTEDGYGEATDNAIMFGMNF